MLTDFEIREISRQLFDCIRILKRSHNKIKKEEFDRRYVHKNRHPERMAVDGKQIID